MMLISAGRLCRLSSSNFQMMKPCQYQFGCEGSVMPSVMVSDCHAHQLEVTSPGFSGLCITS